MILNNGRYEVDTSQADFVGKSVKTQKGDGYSFESEEHFTAYRSRRTGQGFIVLGHKTIVFKLFQRLNPSMQHQLVEVYESEDAFAHGRHRYGIWLDSELDALHVVRDGQRLEKI